MAGKPKGLPKTGGRTKGSGNILNRDVKEMVMIALSEVGGKDYLVRLAQDDPKSFVPLIGKCMPSTVDAKHTGTIGLSGILSSIDGITADLPDGE